MPSKPMQWVGGYELHLYCQNEIDYDHDRVARPARFVGGDFGDCAKLARLRGWVLHRDRTATCPQCNKRVKDEQP